ncbi:hypothetical protein OKW50_007999 [Paraburkholderia youngii]|uniref:hypothetical protein n=1 Tax=Paraburkholderia youngii TaxID=2782701 RepID=UPI003D1B1C01
MTSLTRHDSTIVAWPFRLQWTSWPKNFRFYEGMGAKGFFRIKGHGGIQVPTGLAFAPQVCHAPCHHDGKAGALEPADGSQLQVLTLQPALAKTSTTWPREIPKGALRCAAFWPSSSKFM